jgi:hypothetical protein
MKLSARRAKFVDEYILDHNGSRAARSAGYAVTSAHVTASRLLSNDNVIAALDAKKQELAQQYDIDKHRVVNELLDAVAVARESLDAGSMIRAWCEISKLLGINTPEVQKIAIYAESNALRAKYEAMSDDELIAIATSDTSTTQ